MYLAILYSETYSHMYIYIYIYVYVYMYARGVFILYVRCMSHVLDTHWATWRRIFRPWPLVASTPRKDAHVLQLSLFFPRDVRLSRYSLPECVGQNKCGLVVCHYHDLPKQIKVWKIEGWHC